jgi:DNA polymerase-1
MAPSKHAKPNAPVRKSRHASESAKDDRPLLAVDGDSFAHRSYHALPKSIRRGDGSAAGAIVGFGNFLLRLWRAERPRAVIVAWDMLEESTYRHEALEAYQSGREFDDDLVDQLDALPAFVEAFGFAVAKKAGYEADDFLAAAATLEEQRRGQALIATGDRDSFQLASERVTILYPVKGGELLRIGPAEVRERYGVDPAQVPDFIALRGDPSDRIPGARGVGAKGAATLLQKYGSLEAMLEQGSFPGQEKDLRLYRSIATMDRKAPLPKLAAQPPAWNKAALVARNWGLLNLAERIDQLAEEEAARKQFRAE